MRLPVFSPAPWVMLFFCIFITSHYLHAQEVPVLDIIVEADTYTPYFYAGRSEPSLGNQLRLVAVSPDTEIPTSYRWRVGSSYFSTDGPALETTMPIVEQRILVEVTALGHTSVALSRGAEYVSATAPRLLFYEDNALRGISRVALQSNLILVGDETTIKAEPYFAGTNLPSSLRSTWASNLSIEPSPESWQLLYLRRGDTEATTGQVHLKVANPSNLNEYLTASFDVSL